MAGASAIQEMNPTKNDNAAILRGDGSTTLNDVARAAGVSPATVSRCLNDPYAVRPAKREKVFKVIDELGYLPHGAARALASRRSRMIGALFPSLDNTLFGGMMETLQGEVAAAGYTLVVASSAYDPAQELKDVRNLILSGVDALTLVGASRDPAVYDLIRRKKIPYILNWISEAEGGHTCVGFDNAEAAASVARYLLDLGHRRFALISGFFANNDRASARRRGIESTLRERGVALPPERVLERPFGVDEGREAFRLLMSMPEPPSAVICGGEPFAYGAIFESHEIGIRIPDDVSVTGFDDMWPASQITPSLTTVQTPRRQIGIDVARHLLAKLSRQPIADPKPLDTKLVVRNSTGQARRA